MWILYLKMDEGHTGIGDGDLWLVVHADAGTLVQIKIINNLLPIHTP